MCVISSESHFIPESDLVQWEARRLRSCYNRSLQAETNWVSLYELFFRIYLCGLNSRPFGTRCRLFLRLTEDKKAAALLSHLSEDRVELDT